MNHHACAARHGVVDVPGPVDPRAGEGHKDIASLHFSRMGAQAGSASEHVQHGFEFHDCTS